VHCGGVVYPTTMTFFRYQRFDGKSNFAGKYKDKAGIAEMALASLTEIKVKKDATWNRTP
jgi:hypothetical protein